MRFRVLLLIALAVIGCRKGEDQRAATDLQIVSTGNEPRQRLHYQATKGAQQQLDVAVDVEINAGDMGGPMPTIVMTLSLAVEDVVPIGAKLRSTVVDVTARDRDESRVPANAISGPLANLKGVVLTTTLTSNGRLIGTKVDTGGKQLPESAKKPLGALTTSFDQLMMPLPDEPVGVGAVWRNSRPLEQNGMKMIAVNTVKLTSITGDKIGFDLETQIHGDDQTIRQGELAVDIKDVVGTGSGKGTIDLRTLAMTSELTSELRSTMQSPGEAQAMPMKLTIATHVAPH
jgi:Family of unknown function (DUF6263)